MKAEDKREDKRYKSTCITPRRSSMSPTARSTCIKVKLLNRRYFTAHTYSSEKITLATIVDIHGENGPEHRSISTHAAFA